MNTHSHHLIDATGTLPRFESGRTHSSANTGHDGVVLKLILALASLFELAAALDVEAFSL